MEFVASKSATNYSKFSTASESVKGRMNRAYSLPSRLPNEPPNRYQSGRQTHCAARAPRCEIRAAEQPAVSSVKVGRRMLLGEPSPSQPAERHDCYRTRARQRL